MAIVCPVCINLFDMSCVSDLAVLLAPEVHWLVCLIPCRGAKQLPCSTHSTRMLKEGRTGTGTCCSRVHIIAMSGH